MTSAFRPRQWRNDRVRLSVPRWLDDSIRELIDDLREKPPIHVLQFAATSVAQAGDQERNVRLGLVAYAHPQTTMLAVAMAWLADGTVSGEFAALDVPAWLGGLGQGTVRGAMRQPEHGDTRSYLLELEVAGDHLGAIQVRVDERGAICNAFVLEDDLWSAAQLLRGLDRGSPYRRIKPATAVRELQAARASFDTGPPFEPERFNPWPMNRALLDFVLDRYLPP